MAVSLLMFSIMFVSALASATCFVLFVLHAVTSDVFRNRGTIVYRVDNYSVQGKCEHFRDRTLHVFRGITFARVPKRFASSEMVLIEDNVDATMFGSPCAQPTTGITPDITDVSEDCLTLNIWSTAVIRDNYEEFNESAPVVILLYGGGFNVGAGSQVRTDGMVLAAMENVIVVSFNYRVGAFGFAGFAIPDAPLNVGLMDQQLAFKWVHLYISYFGGDPHRVTLFGTSAGAMSVGNHMTIPDSRHYFHRAILDGGTPWLATEAAEKAVNRTVDMARRLGCSGEISTNFDTILACLRSRSKEEIIQVQLDLSEGVDTASMFIPSFGTRLLPLNPKDFYLRRISEPDNFPDVLQLLNRDEGSMFIVKDYREMEIKPEFTNTHQIEEMVNLYRSLIKDSNSDWNDIKAFYMTGRSEKTGLHQVATAAIGDFIFMCPAMEFACLATRNYYQKVTTVLFSHESAATIYPRWMGAHHTLAYMFSIGLPLKLFADKASPTDIQITHKMMEMIRKFVKIPSSSPRSGLVVYDGETLQLADKTTMNVYEIDDVGDLIWHQQHPRANYCCTAWIKEDVKYCSHKNTKP